MAMTDDAPVSDRIRARLVKAQQRFHANDNISAFIEDGELEQLQDEVEARLTCNKFLNVQGS